jgi:hypothetical protein
MKIRIILPSIGSSALLEKSTIFLLLPLLGWSVFRGATVYANATADSAFENAINFKQVVASRGVSGVAVHLLRVKTPQMQPVRGPRCSPLRDEELAWVVDGVTKKYDVESSLLRAIIETESSRRPCITSVRGAIGLMQVMPGTAKELGISDPYDPRSNVEAGAKYLKLMLTRYNNDIRRALSAYNAGPGVTDRHEGIPPIAETQKYVQTVMRRAEAFSNSAVQTYSND